MRANKSSIFATLFLVLSLVTVVGITENPLKGIAFQSYARVSGTANANRAERQALKEGGDKWTVLASDGSKHQCKGSECYGIQLGTVQSVANAKTVAKVVLTDQQILENACTNEGGRYINSVCYERGQIPPVIPKTDLNANDYAQVAGSNANNEQIEGVRALCTQANTVDTCKNAAFLERYALNVLNNMDSSANKSIYNNALNKFNQNQDYINKKVETTSAKDLSGIIANEQKFGLSLPQNPSTKVSVPDIIVVDAPNPQGCKNAAGDKYGYSWNRTTLKCTLTLKKDSGIIAAVVQQQGTTAQPATPAQCGALGKTPYVSASFKDGVCTITPVSSQQPPIQSYIGPLPNGATGYYLSCIQSQCPTGNVASYGGKCACAITPQPKGPVHVSAGITYYAFATNIASPEEKTALQNECDKALQLKCDAKTLSTYVTTQLKATDTSLYNLAQQSASVPEPVSQPVVEGGDCTANCPKSPVYTYKGTIHNNSCQCAPTNALPAPAPAPQGSSSVTAGAYNQRDFTNIVIPNTDGHTIATLGCGVVAVTNILNSAGYNYTPQQVLNMIKPQDWSPTGIGGESSGDFLQLLSNSKNYNPAAGVDFKFGIKPMYADPINIWNRMSQDQVLWVGSQYISGNLGGKNIPHITYLIPTSQKDTFKMQTNDYFGSNMTCKPGKTSKGVGFNCSNDKGDTVEIPTNNQAVYTLTPSGK